MLAIALTNFGATAPAGVAAKIVSIAEAKTTGYAALGFAGFSDRVSNSLLFAAWLLTLSTLFVLAVRLPLRRPPIQ